MVWLLSPTFSFLPFLFIHFFLFHSLYFLYLSLFIYLFIFTCYLDARSGRKYCVSTEFSVLCSIKTAMRKRIVMY